MQAEWLDRGEALARLRVKPQTLYAYVSRGRISARPDPRDTRRSLYASEDIDRLIRGEAPALGAGRSASTRGQTVLSSAISAVLPDTLHYRGVCATELSNDATLESVASLLWGRPDGSAFQNVRFRPDVSFPGTPRARAFAILARRSEEDAVRPAPEDLEAEAASVLNEMVDGIAGGGPRLRLHQRVARAFKLKERDAELVRRTLVLCADHVLDEAALAARIAASAGASLAACALAALSVNNGSRLGGRLMEAENFVFDARRLGPRAAISQKFEQLGDLPGFGSEHHPNGDPRAQVLIDAMQLSGDAAEFLRLGMHVSGAAPALEIALALVGWRLDLPREAPAGLFTAGRAAGWLAHALEQMHDGGPVKFRALYAQGGGG